MQTVVVETIHSNLHITSGARPRTAVIETGKPAHPERTTDTLLSRAATAYLAEYNKAKDQTTVILAYAKAKGLIDNTTIADGSITRWFDMSDGAKAALAPERIVELTKHNTPGAAATYQAAFALAGVPVPEMTKQHFDHIAKRERLINLLVDTPETRADALRSMNITL